MQRSQWGFTWGPADPLPEWNGHKNSRWPTVPGNVLVQQVWHISIFKVSFDDKAVETENQENRLGTARGSGEQDSSVPTTVVATEIYVL